jgi:SSS family solute:Na+ symporter
LDLGNITVGCWIIGTLAAVYVFAGGLKACAWADLIQGSALIVGGVIIAFLALQVMNNADPQALMETARNSEVTAESLEQSGAIQRFWELNKGPLPDGKVHMVRDTQDKEIPWTALLIGLWIPNFFYWGLNQYITQRTLGSKSLAEGQKGVVFAAFLKLIIPFIVVVPGMLAFNLFNADLRDDAINRNALIVSERSPELYSRLSDRLKPDAADERNRNIIDRVNENLANATVSEMPQLYRFDAEFAELNVDDAAAVAGYNVDILGPAIQAAPLPDEGASADQWAAFNETVIAAATGQETKQVAVETLVTHDFDNAFPTLIRKLLPIGNGLKGFVLAAIFGAVVSSLASMLNSASTIAAMDIYHKVRKNASQYELVTVGRVCVVLFVLIAMIIAPWLGRPEFGGIFTYIQEFQGFISPGILAIFLFGLLVHRAPRSVGTVGLVLNPFLYGGLKYAAPQIAFLDRMAICFFIVIAVLTVMTLAMPLKEPVTLPVNKQMDIRSSPGAKVFGIFVVLMTLALYAVFW